MRSISPISGAGTSSRVSWADELDLGMDSSNPLNLDRSSVVDSINVPLIPNLSHGNSTVPLFLNSGTSTVPLNSKNQEKIINSKSGNLDKNSNTPLPVQNDAPIATGQTPVDKQGVGEIPIVGDQLIVNNDSVKEP
ncbi:uncharacterized protein A4U43_C05F17070 [Asparagus officinalis]|uniref:Uncharacterized protein n=1 Tax=Asparagus officinalis TaxID=4686 RepID=A0A5P1ESE8_ASPOF|nr:uncharacterized protein A4U43_C05F17070 [Asparagus officinalis]